MARKKIRVGLDFDGVVAYNPFRVARLPVAFFKRKILGIRKLKFFLPEKGWQKMLWVILHESSLLPAQGVSLLSKCVNTDSIEFHLITGRYNFVTPHLYQWLDRHTLQDIFKTININEKNEQPHEFKHRMIETHHLDYFVEDNLDIVEYLHSRTPTKIYWIYNMLDRNHPHPYKFPYLEKALKAIIEKSKYTHQKYKP